MFAPVLPSGAHGIRLFDLGKCGPLAVMAWGFHPHPALTFAPRESVTLHCNMIR